MTPQGKAGEPGEVDCDCYDVHENVGGVYGCECCWRRHVPMSADPKVETRTDMEMCMDLIMEIVQVSSWDEAVIEVRKLQAERDRADGLEKALRQIIGSGICQDYGPQYEVGCATPGMPPHEQVPWCPICLARAALSEREKEGR